MANVTFARNSDRIARSNFFPSPYRAAYGNTLLSGFSVMGSDGNRFPTIPEHNMPTWNDVEVNTLAQQAYLKARFSSSNNGYWRSWTSKTTWPRQVYFPAYIPSALTDLQRFRTPVYVNRANHAAAIGEKIITEWGEYLYNEAASIRDYRTAIKEYADGCAMIRRNYRDYTNVYDNYVKPYVDAMIALMNERQDELAAQMQASVDSLEAEYNDARSYFLQGIQALAKIVQTTDAYVAWQAWEAIFAFHKKTLPLITRWNTIFAGTPYHTEIGDLYKQYWSLLREAETITKQKEAAAAEAEGKTYGEVAVTTKMRTGLFSKAQISVETTTQWQVTEATNKLGRYISALEPALTMSLSKASELYGKVTPEVSAWFNGLSQAVRTNAQFRAKAEEYNTLIVKIETRFKGTGGGKGIGWIIGIGAAVIGVAALAA